MSGIDLSDFKDGIVGPREKEALLNEITLLTHTREIALRRQAELEGTVASLERVLAAVVQQEGDYDTTQDDMVLVLGEDAFDSVVDNVASFEIIPDGDYLRLVNTYKADG